METINPDTVYNIAGYEVKILGATVDPDNTDSLRVFLLINIKELVKKIYLEQLLSEVKNFEWRYWKMNKNKYTPEKYEEFLKSKLGNNKYREYQNFEGYYTTVIGTKKQWMPFYVSSGTQSGARGAGDINPITIFHF